MKNSWVTMHATAFALGRRNRDEEGDSARGPSQLAATRVRGQYFLLKLDILSL
jgi:hypothetical protein